MGARMAQHTGPVDDCRASRPSPIDAALRAELQRILDSPVFGRSPDPVATALARRRAPAGRRSADELKESTIAVDVFRRAPDFDPRHDPIVRVTANRLRVALARFYRKHGHVHGIEVQLPVGQYLPARPPAGVRRSLAAAPDAADARRPGPRRRRPSRLPTPSPRQPRRAPDPRPPYLAAPPCRSLVGRRSAACSSASWCSAALEDRRARAGGGVGAAGRRPPPSPTRPYACSRARPRMRSTRSAAYGRGTSSSRAARRCRLPRSSPPATTRPTGPSAKGASSTTSRSLPASTSCACTSWRPSSGTRRSAPRRAASSTSR